MEWEWRHPGGETLRERVMLRGMGSFHISNVACGVRWYGAPGLYGGCVYSPNVGPSYLWCYLLLQFVKSHGFTAASDGFSVELQSQKTLVESSFTMAILKSIYCSYTDYVGRICGADGMMWGTALAIQTRG